MRTIHKFVLSDITHLTLQDPKFLHVAEQYGVLALWVEVDADTNTAPTTWRLEVVGTGHYFHFGNAAYIGTAVLEKAGLVLHVYASEVL